MTLRRGNPGTTSGSHRGCVMPPRICACCCVRTVANARSAIDTFEALGYKGQKPILLVVNQADTAAGMSKGGIEHALNLPVIAEIPTDWKTVSESLNKQQPFVISAPTTAVSKAVDHLATALVSQQRK